MKPKTAADGMRSKLIADNTASRPIATIRAKSLLAKWPLANIDGRIGNEPEEWAMNRDIVAAFVALSLLAPSSALAQAPQIAEILPIVPDPILTPGVVATTDQADICGVVGGLRYTERHRFTTQSMKDGTFSKYQIVKGGRDFEVDHRVPICAGGADVKENLWPQLGWLHPSYHDKDRLEDQICRLICKGSVSVTDGQAIFMGDWTLGYAKVFGKAP